LVKKLAGIFKSNGKTTQLLFDAQMKTALKSKIIHELLLQQGKKIKHKNKPKKKMIEASALACLMLVAAVKSTKKESFLFKTWVF